MRKIKQVWIPYTEWEDWHNGMWRKVSFREAETFLPIAVDFTGNWLKYGAVMALVVFRWPRTMLHNLTNPSLNQRAFVGHCACCMELSLPESIVRTAWKRLTDLQRREANLAADRAIESWRIWHYNKGQYKIEFPINAERM